MKPPCLKRMIVACGLALSAFSQVATADTTAELMCKVSGSSDYFKVYPHQRIYSSNDFLHYQLIAGLTILVVNKHTMRFNRLSNLNLLPHSTLAPNRPPEELQLFHGQCRAN